MSRLSTAPHPLEQAADRISIRSRLDGRSIDIVKKSDGTWEASIFPSYRGEPFDISGAGDDPVAAVARLVRQMQKLPQ